MISLLIIIYIAFLMIGLQNVLGSAWPAIHVDLDVSAASAGIISMILLGLTILSAFLCDKVTRLLGARRVTLISLIVVAISMIGFSMGTHFISLCLWSVPLGFGMGLVDATLNNVVALHYEAKHMSWFHASWGVGAVIGPMIMSAFLVRQNSWAAGYQFIGFIIFAFIAIFLLTSKLWKKIQVPTDGIEESKQKALTLKQLLGLPGVKQSLLIFFCYCTIEVTVGLWASSYFVIVRNLAEETAALWVSLYYVGITAGRFMSGFLSMKISHNKLIKLSSGLIGLGLIILLLPVSETFLLISLFLIGLGCAPIFPSLIHETPNNFGTVHSQAIIGVQMAFAYIGAALMPPLFGILAELTSYRIFPYYLIAFLILMVIMVKYSQQKVRQISINKKVYV